MAPAGIDGLPHRARPRTAALGADQREVFVGVLREMARVLDQVDQRVPGE
ncbi:hypothetical protein ABTY98_06535 [Streptomyces sp. NPDC096040]